MITVPSFWYLGTPYSKYPGGLEAAFVAACQLTGRLAKCGVPIYSPIAHSHPIAVHGQMDAVDHDLWVRFDAPLVRAAGGLIVAMLDGWYSSRGLRHEIDTFKADGKPIIYWDTVAADVPPELQCETVW